MDVSLFTSALVSSATLAAWCWLVLARCGFWRTDQRLRPATGTQPDSAEEWPAVAVVVPARNEADVLPSTLPTLLGQDYPGPCHVFLVDDGSDDGTPGVALEVASVDGSEERLTVVAAEPRPQGWSGKVWALAQGVEASRTTVSEYLLFTDADIAHPPDSLASLVRKARAETLNMVSLMAHLRVVTLWDRLLVPAFVYFFGKLYPFRWVNDPRRSTAAAAGGCMLVRRDALDRSGGLESISGALIDDCALARRIKSRSGPSTGKVWLGLSHEVMSVRAYETLRPMWDTVSRTAYAQLDFSAIRLAATVIGMLALYLAPPVATAGGILALVLGRDVLGTWLAASGLGAWTLMAASYLPMLGWYRTSPAFAPLLPVTAFLYTDDRRLRTPMAAWGGRRLEGPHVLGCSTQPPRTKIASR